VVIWVMCGVLTKVGMQARWGQDVYYALAIWRCNAKFNREQKCATPHLTEDEINAMFLKAYNELMGNRAQVISDCRLMLEMLSDHSLLDAQIANANEEITLVSGLVSACVHENAEKALAQEEYNDWYASLVNRHQKAIARLEKLKAACADKVNRERELRGGLRRAYCQPAGFGYRDEQLWRLLVVKGMVGRDGSVVFKFRG